MADPVAGPHPDPEAGPGAGPGDGAGAGPVPSQRTAPLATLAAGAVCAVVAGVQLGGPGVVSAVLATAVVAAFFWSGLVPLLLVGDGAEGRGFALVVLLLNYVLRLVGVLLVLALASAAGAVDRGAVGLTVMVCAVVWTTASAVGLGRPSG